MDKVTLRLEVLKQIRELHELNEIGAITEDEYKQKKKVLLNDI